GNGVSMVTLYYLRRFLVFCLAAFRSLKNPDVSLSEEVAQFLLAVCRILERHRPMLGRPVSDAGRKLVLDDLGRAGSRYREHLYARGLSGRCTRMSVRRILEFLKVALAFADDSIHANRRPDGLYHAYNLVKLDNRNGIS